jgi:hypothetical protein
MIVLGYDFYKDNSIQKPNGLIGHIQYFSVIFTTIFDRNV